MSVDDIELRLGGLRLLPPRDGDSQAVNQASQSGDEAFAFRVQGGQPGGQLFKISTSVISKVPYLESIQSGRFPVTTDPSDGAAVLVDPVFEPGCLQAILAYAHSGQHRHLLSHLSSGAQVSQLLELWDFLAMPRQFAPLESLVLKDPFSRTTSRQEDAAVELILGLYAGVYDPKVARQRDIVYHKVLFIVSHPRTFGRRLRHHAFNAARELCAFTPKQMRQLDEWKGKWGHL